MTLEKSSMTQSGTQAPPGFDYTPPLALLDRMLAGVPLLSTLKGTWWTSWNCSLI